VARGCIGEMVRVDGEGKDRFMGWLGLRQNHHVSDI